MSVREKYSIYHIGGTTQMANIIISPSRYVQGSGELGNIAKHIGGLGNNFFLLGSSSGLKRVEDTIKKSFEGFFPISGEKSFLFMIFPFPRKNR